MRWIWIDKFLEFRSGQFARAIKNLTLADAPQNPRDGQMARISEPAYATRR